MSLTTSNPVPSTSATQTTNKIPQAVKWEPEHALVPIDRLFDLLYISFASFKHIYFVYLIVLIIIIDKLKDR